MCPASSERNCRPEVTFVIPARNAENEIGRAIDSIRRTMTLGGLQYEIVVADHGSDDATSAVARKRGARVVDAATAKSVAEARNRAAVESNGAVLVFVDSDVTLDETWSSAFASVRSRLDRERIITGSQVSMPPEASRLERVWFGSSRPGARYINSGHLIVPGSVFAELGGFDSRLVSAEDHDLCNRLRGLGGMVIPDPALRAYHHGNPRSVAEFFRREVWHGIGDASATPLRRISGVGAVARALFTAVVVSVPAAVLLRSALPLLVPVVALLAVSLAASVRRSKRAPIDIPVLTALYVVYFSARCVSYWHVLLRSPSGGASWRRDKRRGT